MTASLRLSFVCSLVLAACGGDPPTGAPASTDVAAAVQKLVLAADPGEAQAVQAAKAAGARDRAVVFGRIANIVPGYAVFTLMDTSLPYCGETNTEDGCKTPWDYCCENTATRTANALLVEARDADGKPLQTPMLPDLRLLDAVKVTGRLTKDEHGNQVLLADGLFRTGRPTLPDDLHWPH
jgi:hypothetical protein